MVQFEIINNVVVVDKEITELDRFVLDVLEILKKYADYVIINGYVSIFFGRARSTEDVDLFIRDVSIDKFRQMYDEAVEKGYEWTIDDPQALYAEYLKENVSVCVWKKDFPLLRIEMKLALKLSQRIAFQDRITVKFKGNIVFMANIESQIAYKRYIAKSEKDMTDARHLELVFKNINNTKVEQYRRLFEEEFNGR